MEIVHKPVLLNECLELLSPEGEPYEKCAVMVDSTLGEGGHSYNFLKKYKNLSVIGLDADSVIQKRAKERLSEFGDRMSFSTAGLMIFTLINRRSFLSLILYCLILVFRFFTMRNRLGVFRSDMMKSLI